MGKPKTVSNETDSTSIMSFYCPKSLRDEYTEFCNATGQKKSPLIRKHMIEDIADWRGGRTEKTFDYEGANKKRTSLKREEDKLYKMLLNEFLGDTSVYEVLIGFAVSLGTDASLTKNIDKVLVVLKNYQCDGSEVFNNSHRITFIQFIEKVLARRVAEAEIDAYWGNRGSKVYQGKLAEKDSDTCNSEEKTEEELEI